MRALSRSAAFGFLLWCVVACGSERNDGPVSSTGPGPGPALGTGSAGDGGGPHVDAGTSSGGGAVDGGKGDGGTGDGGSTDGGALDPRTCAVGPADGCCPVALAYGGADPDCAALSCSTSTKDAPIPLHAPIDMWLGQVAGAWSGTELVLASTRETVLPTTFQQVTDVVVQRRDTSGALLGPDVVRRLSSVAPGRSATELAVHPSGDLLFAWESLASQQYLLVRLPAAGAPLWTAALGAGCNEFSGSLRIFPDGPRVIAGMAQYACTGAYQPLVWSFDAVTGAPSVSPAKASMLDLKEGDHSDIVGGAGFAFHPASHTLDVHYGPHYQGGVRTRTLDFVAETKSPSVQVLPAGNTLMQYDPVVAFDGVKHGILTREHAFDLLDTTTYVFRRRGPSISSTTPSVDLASFSDADTLPLLPSIIWTGDGYVVAIPYVTPYTNNATPERLNHRTRIVRLDAAGAILETFELDVLPSMFPKLVWAGGRVAITWLRPSGPSGVTSQGFLRFLHCD